MKKDNKIKVTTFRSDGSIKVEWVTAKVASLIIIAFMKGY